VELTVDEHAELLALVNSPDVSAAVATRARIVLWHAENRPKKEIAALAGVSRPTVDLWLRRYGADGVAGLLDRPRGAGREQMSAQVRARILAATRSSPPARVARLRWRRDHRPKIEQPGPLPRVLGADDLAGLDIDEGECTITQHATIV
jgi:Helix-turn-helix domain